MYAAFHQQANTPRKKKKAFYDGLTWHKFPLHIPEQTRQKVTMAQASEAANSFYGQFKKTFWGVRTDWSEQTYFGAMYNLAQRSSITSSVAFSGWDDTRQAKLKDPSISSQEWTTFRYLDTLRSENPSILIHFNPRSSPKLKPYQRLVTIYNKYPEYHAEGFMNIEVTFSGSGGSESVEWFVDTNAAWQPGLSVMRHPKKLARILLDYNVFIQELDSDESAPEDFSKMNFRTGEVFSNTVLLFAHGNQDSVKPQWDVESMAIEMLNLGGAPRAFAIEYPRYQNIPGEGAHTQDPPDAKSAVNAALAAYQYLVGDLELSSVRSHDAPWPPFSGTITMDDIILVGYSVGTGVMGQFAKRLKTLGKTYGAIVLSNGFASILRTQSKAVRRLGNVFGGDTFDTKTAIAGFDEDRPFVLVHGMRDAKISVTNGYKLFQEAHTRLRHVAAFLGNYGHDTSENDSSVSFSIDSPHQELHVHLHEVISALSRILNRRNSALRNAIREPANSGHSIAFPGSDSSFINFFLKEEENAIELAGRMQSESVNYFTFNGVWRPSQILPKIGRYVFILQQKEQLLSEEIQRHKKDSKEESEEIKSVIKMHLTLKPWVDILFLNYFGVLNRFKKDYAKSSGDRFIFEMLSKDTPKVERMMNVRELEFGSKQEEALERVFERLGLEDEVSISSGMDLASYQEVDVGELLALDLVSTVDSENLASYKPRHVEITLKELAQEELDLTSSISTRNQYIAAVIADPLISTTATVGDKDLTVEPLPGSVAVRHRAKVLLPFHDAEEGAASEGSLSAEAFKPLEAPRPSEASKTVSLSGIDLPPFAAGDTKAAAHSSLRTEASPSPAPSPPAEASPPVATPPAPPEPPLPAVAPLPPAPSPQVSSSSFLSKGSHVKAVNKSHVKAVNKPSSWWSSWWIERPVRFELP